MKNRSKRSNRTRGGQPVNMGGALKSRIMPARGSNRGAVKAVVNLNPSLAGGAPVDNLLIEALD